MVRWDELTRAEQRAVKALDRLAGNWPKGLWLFSASGTLWVMRTDQGGERVVEGHGGVDPAYRAASIKIPNDGGDW